MNAPTGNAPIECIAALFAWMTVVCLIFAAWIGLTERSERIEDDDFRRRWTGSDAKHSDDDTGE